MKAKHNLIVLMVLISTSLGADPTFVAPTIVRRANPALQSAAAQELMRKANTMPPSTDRDQTVAAAAANLLVIEQLWPENHNAVIEATAMLSRLYLDNGWLHNAERSARHGIAMAPKDHRFYFVLGSALASLNKYDDAKAAFASAAEYFDPGVETSVRGVDTLNKVAFFSEKRGEGETALKALRKASRLNDLAPTIRLDLALRTFALSVQNNVGRHDDYVFLVKTLDDVRTTTITPEQKQLVEIAAATVKKYSYLSD